MKRVRSQRFNRCEDIDQEDRRIVSILKILALPLVVGRIWAWKSSKRQESMPALLYSFLEIMGLIFHLRWMSRLDRRNPETKSIS